MKIKPITAWAVLKDNKINVLEIYDTQDIHLSSDETIIKVIIAPYDTKPIQKKAR